MDLSTSPSQHFTDETSIVKEDSVTVSTVVSSTTIETHLKEFGTDRETTSPEMIDEETDKTKLEEEDFEDTIDTEDGHKGEENVSEDEEDDDKDDDNDDENKDEFIWDTVTIINDTEVINAISNESGIQDGESEIDIEGRSYNADDKNQCTQKTFDDCLTRTRKKLGWPLSSNNQTKMLAQDLFDKFCSIHQEVNKCREKLICDQSKELKIPYSAFIEAHKYQCLTIKEAGDELESNCYLDKGALKAKFKCFQEFIDGQKLKTDGDHNCRLLKAYVPCVRNASAQLANMSDSSVNTIDCTEEFALIPISIAEIDGDTSIEHICVTLPSFETSAQAHPFEDSMMAAGHRRCTHTLLIGCGLVAAWSVLSSHRP
jgi:hypothetical protein